MKKSAGFLTGLMMSATAALAQDMPSDVLFFGTINKYEYLDGVYKSLDKNDKTPYAADFILSGTKPNALGRAFDTVTCADIINQTNEVEVRFLLRYLDSGHPLTRALGSSVHNAVGQARNACALGVS